MITCLVPFGTDMSTVPVPVLSPCTSTVKQQDPVVVVYDARSKISISFSQL